MPELLTITSKKRIIPSPWSNIEHLQYYPALVENLHIFTHIWDHFGAVYVIKQGYGKTETQTATPSDLGVSATLLLKFRDDRSKQVLAAEAR